MELFVELFVLPVPVMAHLHNGMSASLESPL
jgi:hypothetical protein